MAGIERARSGCGVEGCLFGAVALFVIMLVGLLVLAAIRFRDRPSSEDVQRVGHNETSAKCGVRSAGCDGALRTSHDALRTTHSS